MRVEGLPFDTLDIVRVENNRMEEEFNLIHPVHYVHIFPTSTQHRNVYVVKLNIQYFDTRTT